MTDQPTRDAAAALAYRIRHRGDTDPDVLAAEFMASLRSRGWRHMPSLAPQADAGTLPAEPSDDYRRARAELRRPEWTS